MFWGELFLNRAWKHHRNLLTDPIGYLESCFSAKNGTPRQPSICSHSRACLRIRKSIFNNPEHSLMGLEQFSHVWILFVFHKNGRLSCKAKVQPPRLNGAKTGVFSTRSPHRPNAIGLTLAKLEKVEGGAVHLSGIDMVHGTPVLDIKPYIADYDSPREPREPPADAHAQPPPASPPDGRPGNRARRQPRGGPAERPRCPEGRAPEGRCPEPDGRGERAADFGLDSARDDSPRVAEGPRGRDRREESVSEEGPDARMGGGEEAATLRGSAAERQPVATGAPRSEVPAWVRAPAAPLAVRFTPHAEADLGRLGAEGAPDVGHTSFKYFRSADEAKHAIEAVLSADPRSVYRRKLCQDRLFYFTVDIAHITCWFGDGFVEVLRIKHASEVARMIAPAESRVPLGP
ncbi:tRNA (adenine(37)-N6)-methyltransferase isoform X2 [Choloepus didactylus]|uniref:tRNA (adenine(37)-N6)-methyltransferase isoform X2 n=1 Tax=Choloepus didactylus TaxID=27675 RepID=UPI00189EDE50|nr:tRNA (adenine(37)-N6)-methyltransferase isoform X2 [Choloepus didactylus]